jgi:hypothetical protein
LCLGARNLPELALRIRYEATIFTAALKSLPLFHSQSLSRCNRPTTIPGATPISSANWMTSELLVSVGSRRAWSGGIKISAANWFATVSRESSSLPSSMKVSLYRSEIQAGDSVAFWRAGGGTGRPAGIVGVGRVTQTPCNHGIEPEEMRYIRSAVEFKTTEVRSRLAGAPAKCIDERDIRDIPVFAGHQIISKGRQGTWFRLTNQQWATLDLPEITSDNTALVEPPDGVREEGESISGGGDHYLRDRSQRRNEPATFTRTETSIEVQQREDQLVRRYEEHLGRSLQYHVIPSLGGGDLATDAWDIERSLLIEAKSSSSRANIRLAIGQLLDYSRFLPDTELLAVLVPARPQEVLIELLHSLSILVIFENDHYGFVEE